MSTAPAPSRVTRGIKRNYAEISDEAPSADDYVQPRAAKQPRLAMSGRSSSAPPLVKQNDKMVLCYSSGPAMPAFHEYLSDVSTSAIWKDKTKRAIRLPYYSLNPESPNAMQGILVQDPAITGSSCTELPKHLAKVEDDMVGNVKGTSATEATGEAAAALYMCKYYSPAKMIWGAHVHSGAGIDQIWKDDRRYFVVEAKGVGAKLSNSNDADIPAAVQKQMSLGWIYNNLVTMKRQGHQAAIDLMKDVGLEERLNPEGKAFYLHYNNRPKSYYSCSHDPSKQTAELWAVVVEANWSMAGQFGCTRVQDTQLL